MMRWMLASLLLAVGCTPDTAEKTSPDGEKPCRSWRLYLSSGLEWATEFPLAHGADRKASRRFAPGQPVELSVQLRKPPYLEAHMPGLLYLSRQTGGPALPERIAIRVAYAPFDPRAPDPRYPSPEDYRVLEPIHDTTFTPEIDWEPAGQEVVSPCFIIDLRDWFELGRRGHYRWHWEFGDTMLGRPDSDAYDTFTIGSKPPRVSHETLNRQIPALGGPQAVRRIGDMIDASKGPGRGRNAKDETPQLPWSQPVNGLVGRVVYVSRRHWRFGVNILAEVKNVSTEAIRLPLSRLRSRTQVRPPNGPWKTLQPDPSDQEPAQEFSEGPMSHEAVVLQPQARAVLYAAGFEALPDSATYLQTTLDHQPGKADPDLWTGSLPLGQVAARWTRERYHRLAGTLPFPSWFPSLNHFGCFRPSGSLTTSAFMQRVISNEQLLRVLEIFEPEGVAREFERRMLRTRSEPVKLLQCTVAAQAGSRKAARFLLRSLQETDCQSLINTHDALALALDRRGEEPPAWLVEMIRAAMADRRYATNLARIGYHSMTYRRCGRFARNNTGLIMALGRVRSSAATDELIHLVRSESSDTAICALGDTGAHKAVQPLIDVVSSARPPAETDGGWSDQQLFMDAVGSLAQLRAAPAVPTLLEHMEFPQVIHALGRIGDPRARPGLRRLVADEGRIVVDGQAKYPHLAQRRLVEGRIAVAALDPDDPVARLMDLLSDPSLGVYARCRVVRRLGGQGDHRAIPVLVRAVRSDPAGAVVANAIDALSRFSHEQAIDGLIGSFDADFEGKQTGKLPYTPKRWSRDIAAALREMTGQPMGADPAQWRQWWAQQH